MKTTIAFIIIAYHPNMEEFAVLLRLLKDYPTIIVDNGSTLTLDDAGSATLLSQSKNLGYGAAANIGIHHASGLGSKWFVILNQDVLLTKASVRSLMCQLSRLMPCVAGPFAAEIDKHRWTTILPAHRADYLTGSCLAIHERVVRKVGYFYEPYFLYYEDADYGIRAKRAGFPLVTLTVADITHEESVSLGRGSKLHRYYLARNHLLFVKRLAPMTVKLYEFFRGAKTVVEHLFRNERGALRGIWDFVLGRFGEYRGRGA